MATQTKRVRMDVSTLLGLVFGVLVIGGGLYLGERLFHPGPTLGFVLLGGLAAVWCGHSLSAGVRLVQLTCKALFRGPVPARLQAEYLFTCAQMVRKGGLPALEVVIENYPDSLLRRGFQLLIDGEKAGTIRQVLEGEIAGVRIRHQHGHALLATAGVGTVAFGLAGMVLGLWSDQALAQAALPLWWAGVVGGVLGALCGKLQRMTAEEVRQQEMFKDGILALHEGHNPHIVLHLQNQYLAPSERVADAELSRRLGG